jgi:hypothetical protein
MPLVDLNKARSQAINYLVCTYHAAVLRSIVTNYVAYPWLEVVGVSIHVQEGHCN